MVRGDSDHRLPHRLKSSRVEVGRLKLPNQLKFEPWTNVVLVSPPSPLSSPATGSGGGLFGPGSSGSTLLPGFFRKLFAVTTEFNKLEKSLRSVCLGKGAVVGDAFQRRIAAADMRDAIDEVSRRCVMLDQELQELKAMRHAPQNEQVKGGGRGPVGRTTGSGEGPRR